LYQTAAALAACVPEVLGGQGKNAAHHHCIVHRKQAGDAALLLSSWGTANRSRMQSSYDPRNAPKTLERTGKNTGEQKTQGTAKKHCKNEKIAINAKNDKNICQTQKDVFIRTPYASEYNLDRQASRGALWCSASTRKKSE
jgi:hypothetical protein